MKNLLLNLLFPLHLVVGEKNTQPSNSVQNTICLTKKQQETSSLNTEKILALLEKTEAFRAMSFNILLQNMENDHLCPCTWKNRKQCIASMIRFHKADVIGLQELLDTQLEDLQDLLPEYDFYAVDWKNGKQTALMNAILLRKNRFIKKNQGYFFLSETPLKPSIGWDAQYLRGVVWTQIQDRKTDRECFIFNTHFDYKGKQARNESARVLREKIAEIVGDKPFVVTGDFNLFPTMGGEDTYEMLTKTNANYPDLTDASKKAYFPHHGPTGTWSGFVEPGQPGIKPDYIFVSNNMSVISHGILSDCFDGLFPSDHLPVVSDLFIADKGKKP